MICVGTNFLATKSTRLRTDVGMRAGHADRVTTQRIQAGLMRSLNKRRGHDKVDALSYACISTRRPTQRGEKVFTPEVMKVVSQAWAPRDKGSSVPRTKYPRNLAKATKITLRLGGSAARPKSE